MTGTAEPLWDFALRAYAAPGVAEACLALQEEMGVDVTLLLWCAWAGAGGVVPDAAAVAAAERAIAPWRAATVRPLRTVRRAMKADLGADPAAAAALRERVKAAELEAERLQLLMLEALPLPAAPRHPPVEAIAGALAACLGPAADAADDRLHPLVAAAARTP